MQVMLMRLMSKGEYLIVPKGTKFTGSGKLGLKTHIPFVVHFSKIFHRGCMNFKCSSPFLLNICLHTLLVNQCKIFCLLIGSFEYHLFLLYSLDSIIDDLHISHNASGMGANIQVLLIRNSSSHSSLDVNGLELPCLAATLCFTRLRNQR